MKKSLTLILGVILVLSLLVPAAADVIWEPEEGIEFPETVEETAAEVEQEAEPEPGEENGAGGRTAVAANAEAISPVKVAGVTALAVGVVVVAVSLLSRVIFRRGRD